MMDLLKPKDITFKRTNFSLPISAMEIYGDYIFVACGSLFSIHQSKDVNGIEFKCLERVQIFNYTTISKIKIIEKIDKNNLHLILIANDYLCSLLIKFDEPSHQNSCITILTKMRAHTSILDIELYQKLPVDEIENTSFYLSTILEENNLANKLKTKMVNYYNCKNKYGYYEEPLSFASDDSDSIILINQENSNFTFNNTIESDCETKSFIQKYNYSFIFVTVDGCVICWDRIYGKNKNTIIDSLDTTLTSACFFNKNSTASLSSSLPLSLSLSLAVGTNDGRVRFFDIDNINKITERYSQNTVDNQTNLIHKHEGRVFGLVSYPINEIDIDIYGFYFASAGEDRSVIIWKLFKNDLTNTKFYQPLSRIFSVCIMPHFINNSKDINNILIVTGSENGVVVFWDNEGHPLKPHKITNCKHITSLCVDQESERIYVSTNSGSICGITYKSLFKNPQKVSFFLPQVLCMIHLGKQQFYAITAVNSNENKNSTQSCQLVHYNKNQLISTRIIENFSNTHVSMSYANNLLTVVSNVGSVRSFTLNEEKVVVEVMHENVERKVNTLKLVAHKNSSCNKYLISLGIYSKLTVISIELKDDFSFKSVKKFNLKLGHTIPQCTDIFNDIQRDKWYIILGYKSAYIDVIEYIDTDAIDPLKTIQSINSSYGRTYLKAVSLFYDLHNQPYLFTSGANSRTTIYEFISLKQCFKLKQQISFPSSFSSIERILVDNNGKYLVCGFFDQKYFVVVDALSNDILHKFNCGGANRCWNLTMEKERIHFSYIKNDYINYESMSVALSKRCVLDIEPRNFTKEIRAATTIYSNKFYHYYVYSGECANVYISMYNSLDNITQRVWVIKKLDSVILDISVLRLSLEENKLRFLLTVVGGKKSIFTYYVKIPLITDNVKNISISDITCYVISLMDPKSFKQKSQMLKYDEKNCDESSEKCLVCECFKKYENIPNEIQFEYCGFKIIEPLVKSVERNYIYLRKKLQIDVKSNDDNDRKYSSDESLSSFQYRYVYYQVYLPTITLVDSVKDSNKSPLEKIRHSHFVDKRNNKKKDFEELDKIFMDSSNEYINNNKLMDDIEPHHRITNVLTCYDSQTDCLLSTVSFSNGFVRIYSSDDYHYKMSGSLLRLNYYNNYRHNCVLCMVDFKVDVNCLLYCSTMGGLFLVFDYCTMYSPGYHKPDTFPHGSVLPGIPILIDVLRINATSMSVIATASRSLRKLKDRKYSIDELMLRVSFSSREFNKVLKNSRNETDSDECVFWCNVSSCSSDSLGSKSSDILLNKSVENMTVDEVCRKKCYSYAVSCADVALGLIDGGVIVMELQIVKIQFKAVSKFRVVDFCYYFSKEFHSGSVTDVYSICPNYFVSIGQDKCLKLWHWSFKEKSIFCVGTVPLQVNDPCKIINISYDCPQPWFQLNTKSEVKISSLGDSVCDVKDKNSIILGVFGYGIEFIQLSIKNS